MKKFLLVLLFSMSLMGEQAIARIIFTNNTNTRIQFYGFIGNEPIRVEVAPATSSFINNDNFRLAGINQPTNRYLPDGRQQWRTINWNIPQLEINQPEEMHHFIMTQETNNMRLDHATTTEEGLEELGELSQPIMPLRVLLQEPDQEPEIYYHIDFTQLNYNDIQNCVTNPNEYINEEIDTSNINGEEEIRKHIFRHARILIDRESNRDMISLTPFANNRCVILECGHIYLKESIISLDEAGTQFCPLCREQRITPVYNIGRIEVIVDENSKKRCHEDDNDTPNNDGHRDKIQKYSIE
jgi:hypothetical protein